MEIVNHDNDSGEDGGEIKSASELAQEGNEVKVDEEDKKEAFAIDPIQQMAMEALANSQEALAVAHQAITTSSQFSVHICAVEQILMSKGYVKAAELTTLVNQLYEQGKQLSEAQIKEVIKKNKGLSPDDTVESVNGEATNNEDPTADEQDGVQKAT